jgi:tetratricopeptide (TPR) repeat protein
LSEIGLVPSVVLGLGLLVGFVIAWRLARGGTSRADADLALRLSDLETERDDVYVKLRGAEGVSLSEADREALELRAARILRDLDAARSQLAKTGARARAPAAAAEPATAPAPARGYLARHPTIAGALLGGGLVGLVAVLVFWAQRDARPAPAEPAATAASGGGQPSATERGEAPLPPQVAAEVAALRQQIQERPEDIAVRRNLAELLLGHGQFFDAFQEARALLEAAPEDPVGHYVSGVVRYTMGNPDAALQHFASARASDPRYAPAAIVEGVVLLQLGDRDAAVAAWEAGLSASAGEPRLEHLLRLAREGKSAEEILATPPPSGP